MAGDNGGTDTFSAGSGGFTLIAAGGPTAGAEYKVVSSAQSGLFVPMTLNNDVGLIGWVMFGDAVQAAACVTASTGGSACFAADAGVITSITASALSSVSPGPPAGLTFPYGLFSFTIGGLGSGQTVHVTITLSSPLPAGAFSYYKFQSGVWTQYPASLDSTRTMITLTFTASPSGTVTDPGGPAITPAVISEYPLGPPLLAIFMIIAYGLIKRRTRN